MTKPDGGKPTFTQLGPAQPPEGTNFHLLDQLLLSLPSCYLGFSGCPCWELKFGGACVEVAADLGSHALDFPYFLHCCPL